LTTRKELSSFRQTTLYRPPVADDYICREHLEARLGRVGTQQIIIVSAPAGYGKSTLISHWVAQANVNCIWISLDKSDSDLGAFLRHLCSGMSNWSPSAADFLQKILNASELPSPNRVADTISARMDESSDELILVLDDYHEIHDASIHLFVESLLMHMPESLRVAIVSRRTPPIALSRLRSRNLILDIRLQDLQFDRSATLALVKSQTGSDVDANILDKLQEITEGWPAGLRMLLLARANDLDMHAYLTQLNGPVWQIQEYLVEEVLAQLPPEVAEHIGITAILGRFSSNLCETLIESTKDAGVSGKQLIELIRNKGLFCIPLDESGEWYRYHHFFQELLLRQVRSRYSDDEIRQLHCRAAKWFDSEGHIEEAVRHFILAENFELGGAVIVRHKDQLILEHQWRRLDLLLSMLPPDTVENSLELLVLMSWVAGRMGRVSQEFEFAQIAQDKIEIGRRAGTVDDAVYGQNCAQCSMVSWFHGDGQAALAAADKALEYLPPSHTFARAEATMMRGVYMQMAGDAAAGQNVLLEAIEKPGGETEIFRARMLIGLCYLNWANGSLRELQHYATILLELGQSLGDDHAIVHACWYSGAALYHFNDLDAAADVVARVIKEKSWPHQQSYSNCVQLMSMIHAARGKYLRALDLSESLVSQHLNSRSMFHLADVHALQAALAHAHNSDATAFQWATNFRSEQVTAGYTLSVAALLAARILLRSEQEDAQERTAAILNEHQSFYESSNNVRFLIETLALRAMLCAKIGDDDTANQLLGRAVSLAEPGGFVRLFVDLGPDIIPLLNRLESSDQQLEYVGTILAGFMGGSGQRHNDNAIEDSIHEKTVLTEALSKRERDVLELLAQRLTNKEIGARLFIAPETVKRHAHNIFDKLNVGDRRAARAKAIGLGLVSE